MIYVIASIALRPGCQERYLRELASLAPEVRAEAGCLEYGGAIDTASGLKPQIPLRPDVVTIVERWSGLEALQAHSVAPHMQAFRARTADWVAGTSLQVLNPV
jgi:quinol monooxygenase YgiN